MTVTSFSLDLFAITNQDTCIAALFCEGFCSFDRSIDFAAVERVEQVVNFKSYLLVHCTHTNDVLNSNFSTGFMDEALDEIHAEDTS